MSEAKGHARWRGAREQPQARLAASEARLRAAERRAAAADELDIIDEGHPRVLSELIERIGHLLLADLRVGGVGAEERVVVALHQARELREQRRVAGGEPLAAGVGRVAR